jgi:NAD(P)H-flavin reductase
MSEYLDSLKIGDSIKVTLPYGRFNYLGNSQIQVR